MFVSIAVSHPLIAKEWDYKKNNGLLPTDVSKGKMIKVYWICLNGHSYQARIDQMSTCLRIMPV